MKIYTGVFYTNDISYIWDDIDHGIDLDYEDHLNKCDSEDHYDCDAYINDHTILIGYIKEPITGMYEVDTSAEYSAIYNEGILQVTHSKWVIYGALCSPCYPDQVNGDTIGHLLGYAPPPTVIADEDRQNLKERIFELKGGE